MATKVGFLGLGIMGRPMAENLAKRYPVVGFDPNPERTAGLKGVQPCDRSGMADCEVVCLSLPASVVEAALLGDQGLIHFLRPGALVLDLSTGTPGLSRKIALTLAEKGIDYADVPVSGGEKGAQGGTLAIMGGATPAVWDRALPYLSAMGTSLVRVGDVGAGNVAKLVNNLIVGVTFSAVAEGFALAAGSGVDPELLYQAIRGGWAASPVLDVSAPAIAAREYRPGGTIDMIQKDLASARTLAAESHVPVPMTAAAHELFVAGQALGRGAQAQPAIYELWARGGRS